MISQEAIDSSVPKEILRIQMDMQRALMDLMRPDGEDITKNGVEWVEIYSAEFARQFEKRIEDDPRFLESCKTKEGFDKAVKGFEILLIATNASNFDSQRMAA